MDNLEKRNLINVNYPISELAYEIGREIYRLRREKGITGKEFAKMIEVSQQQVSRYERGLCYMNFDTFLLSLYYLDESLDGFFFKLWKELSKKNINKYKKLEPVFNSLIRNDDFIEHFSKLFFENKQ